MSIVDLRYDQELESALAQLPAMPSLLDSVTHVGCSPRVCGVTSDDFSSVKILRVTNTAGTLIDGGSNVCITGDLTLSWTSPTSHLSISLSPWMGSHLPWTTKLPNAASCLLLSRTAPHTIKHASIVQTWSKPSFPLLLSLLQVTRSTTGIKKAARILWSWVVSNSPAMMASYRCTSTSISEMAYTTAQRMYSPWIQIQSEFNVAGLWPPRHMM